jgi:hypothetical protein
VRTKVKTIRGNGVPEAWELAENEAMALPRGRFPKVVRVERGSVVITQEGDLVDYVLEPGDELPLGVRGLAVAWALSDATISVHDASSVRHATLSRSKRWLGVMDAERGR